MKLGITCVCYKNSFNFSVYLKNFIIKCWKFVLVLIKGLLGGTAYITQHTGKPSKSSLLIYFLKVPHLVYHYKYALFFCFSMWENASTFSMKREISTADIRGRGKWTYKDLKQVTNCIPYLKSQVVLSPNVNLDLVPRPYKVFPKIKFTFKRWDHSTTKEFWSNMTKAK